jgi:hypothetical protein
MDWEESCTVNGNSKRRSANTDLRWNGIWWFDTYDGNAKAVCEMVTTEGSITKLAAEVEGNRYPSMSLVQQNFRKVRLVGWGSTLNESSRHIKGCHVYIAWECAVHLGDLVYFRKLRDSQIYCRTSPCWPVRGVHSSKLIDR